MKKEDKRLVLAVVGNVLSQYISKLKEHREIAEKLFVAKTGYARANNVGKCSKGIDFAERIMDNLETVLFRDKVWTRKELISVFHNKNYSKEDVASKYELTDDENIVANNVIVTLGNMSIDAPDIFATLIGYTSLRARKELLDGERWQGKVNIGNFGKIGVNYGKPKDFDVLFGTDKTAMDINLEYPYMILRRRIIGQLKKHGANRQISENILNEELGKFLTTVYPRTYGSIVMGHLPTASYQREFVDFRKQYVNKCELKKEYMESLGVLDYEMIG